MLASCLQDVRNPERTRSNRTSCHRWEAIQFRLFLHTVAYWLLLELRGSTPRYSRKRGATFETIRHLPEDRGAGQAVEIPHRHRPADRFSAPGNADPVTGPCQRAKPKRNSVSAARTPSEINLSTHTKTSDQNAANPANPACLAK